MISDPIALVGTQQSGITGTIPIPATNTQRGLRAVCVDVIDLGNVETKWGSKHQTKLIFETEEQKANGFPRTA